MYIYIYDLLDLDAPVVNVIIQSPRDNDQTEKSTKQQSRESKKSLNGNNTNKLGDYNIEDVKVQISLSRLDNHPNKVYSGVWKPDTSTLHRLQGT